jgi:hypothetical protein
MDQGPPSIMRTCLPPMEPSHDTVLELSSSCITLSLHPPLQSISFLTTPPPYPSPSFS